MNYLKFALIISAIIVVAFFIVTATVIYFTKEGDVGDKKKTVGAAIENLGDFVTRRNKLGSSAIEFKDITDEEDTLSDISDISDSNMESEDIEDQYELNNVDDVTESEISSIVHNNDRFRYGYFTKENNKINNYDHICIRANSNFHTNIKCIGDGVDNIQKVYVKPLPHPPLDSDDQHVPTEKRKELPPTPTEEDSEKNIPSPPLPPAKTEGDEKPFSLLLDIRNFSRGNLKEISSDKEEAKEDDSLLGRLHNYLKERRDAMIEEESNTSSETLSEGNF